MSEIVNLRRVRKAKARDAVAEAAAANRELFGRSRAQREALEKTRLADSRKLDGHLREREPDEPRVDAEGIEAR